MTRLDLVVRARRAIVSGEAGVLVERPVQVGVQDGRIVQVRPWSEPRGPADQEDLRAARTVELAADEMLLPGLVDTHVHVNEPGRTHWEGFASATRAAAAGGVTTIIDMPLNSIPATLTVDALRDKQEAARGQAVVDVGFWGGAVPENLDEIESLHGAGVFGFKCFLADSGVDEFPPLDARAFAAAMDQTARLDALMIVHAEDAEVLAGHAPATPWPLTYQDFLASRPVRAEQLAVERVLAEAGRTGGRVHVLHLSAADAVGSLRAARAAGVDVSVETCPHYLTLTAEGVPEGGTSFKCCPPIREHANQDQLWAALEAGDIDMIVSDHSPSTIDLKCLDTGDFGAAWGGIASLQLGLPVVWTEARRRGIPLTQVVGWMASAPAARAGLPHKGRIAVGADADLVAFAPEAEWEVDVTRLHHRNPVSAYAQAHLTGAVRRTWLRGTPVTHDSPPAGRLLQRGPS